MSFALSPPVTSYSAPVTMAAASEARKTATGIASSYAKALGMKDHAEKLETIVADKYKGAIAA
jgi:hypothetical protein